jgi:ketosteroid isomerase-like protein
VARPKTRNAVRKPAKKAAKRSTAKRVAVKSSAKTPSKAKARSKTARPARKAGSTASSSAAIRALAQHIIDVSLAGDDEAILALYASDVESSEAGQPPAVGIDALRAKFEGWRSMTTDNVFEPRRLVVDGNTIVIEWLGRVTLAASGRQVEMREVAIHEIRDGKIAREAFYYNPAVLA